MALHFKQIGPERRDCTAPYKVTFSKEYTVEELVDEILSDDRDWGYIGIVESIEKVKWFEFGDPRCEYRYGKLISPSFSEDVLKKKVIKAICDGGYTRYDYLLEIEE